MSYFNGLTLRYNMKFLMIFFSLSSSVYAITAINMKVGNWQVKPTFEQSPKLKRSLEKLSKLAKENKDQLLIKVKDSSKYDIYTKHLVLAALTATTTGANNNFYKCLIKEDMKNIYKAFMEYRKEEFPDCETIVSTSTKSIFQANIKCKDTKEDMVFSLTMSNDKEGTMSIKVLSTQEKIISKLIWTSKDCAKEK